MPSSLNKFLHGTLWSWIPNELALIISNDEYNSQNPEVNCVSVVGTPDDLIDIENIRCDQIHTIEKESLSQFMGAIPTPILTAVKAKIQKQFNMSDDKTLHAIQETAAKLVGQLARMDSEYVPPAANPMVDATASKESHPLNTIVDMAADASIGNVAPNVILLEPPKDNAVPNSKPANPANKPRGKSDKKPKQAAEISQRTGKPKRKMRSYTDEDEAFVLDGNPTTAEIMERFGFTENRKVHDLKFQLKRRRARRESQ